MTLDELEAITAAATPGSWNVIAASAIETGHADMPGSYFELENVDQYLTYFSEKDASFISAARSAMPKLLAIAKAAQTCSKLCLCQVNVKGTCIGCTLAEALKELGEKRC